MFQPFSNLRPTDDVYKWWIDISATRQTWFGILVWDSCSFIQWLWTPQNLWYWILEHWSLPKAGICVTVGTALWGLKTDHCSPMDHLHPMTVSLWVKMEDPQWPKLLQRWPLITHRWIIILFKMCEIPWNLICSDGWIQYFAGYISHRPSPFFKVKSASGYVFWCHGQPVRNASAARCQGLLHVQPLWRHQATAFQL